ncbi:MAG TPA: hypothetical protein VFA97_10630 [Gaiellaceae bacterium]|nr:hypothetical protein [Gaiellaceae bacterium]
MLLWLPLAFLVVALAGSLAIATVRAWRLWRTVRALSKRITEAVTQVTDAAATAEQHATALTGATERLVDGVARLQRSLAELAVLRAAAGEARAAYAAFRGFVPTK